MVETVYDLCQPSVFTTTFPPNRVQVFSSAEPIYFLMRRSMEDVGTRQRIFLSLSEPVGGPQIFNS